MNWEAGDEQALAYFNATKGRGPNPFLTIAEPHLGPIGHALDLGAGVGNTARWLADRGWTVHAVEPNQDAHRFFAETAGEAEGVALEAAHFHNASLGSYDAVLALFTLFFEEPGRFPATWRRLTASLRPGGVFAGQFLGPNDDWSERCLTHSRAEVEALFPGWEFLHFEEVDRDGDTALGEAKHWHVFHVIARKP
ncbi:MAG: class I SAM-dependent methyltransferase [Fimbriimonadaceae bacterium]|nr:class I SAM-dependent methyltransferase [Fimbriimonadaceae bacterium]QYK55773.1 MAG: class I SAM-dependent methyltransferase [Fimbriimonadaceae bacterium]